MAGIKLFVFALTPRAGARNHVFLVPRDDTAIKRRIDQLAPEVNKVVASAADGFAARPGFLVAWRTVQQRTTGRSGAEWVCVASLWPCSFEPTEQAREFLGQKLSELDLIVTGRQWGDAGELFEQLPELLSWQQEAEEVIRFSPAVGLADSGPAARPRRRPAQLSFLNVLLLAGFVLSLFVIVLRAADWLKRALPGSPPPDIAWHGLAEAVGVPKNQPQNKLKQEILTKLQLLFECDEPNTPFPESPERSIEKFLQAFEKAMGRRGTERLHTLSRSPQLLKELKSLFHDGNFVPTGLVEGLSEETAQFWQSLPARKFHELDNSLVQATEANWISGRPWRFEEIQLQTQQAVDITAQWPSLKEVFMTLDKWSDAGSGGRPRASQHDTSSHTQLGHNIRPNFYLNREKDSLENLGKLLQHICQACNELKKNFSDPHQQKHPSSQPKGTPCANAEGCIKMAVETLMCKAPNKESTILSEVAAKIKNLPGPLQAVEELQKLLHKWAEIVKSD